MMNFGTQLGKGPNTRRWRRLTAIAGVGAVFALAIAAVLVLRSTQDLVAFSGTVLEPPQAAMDFALRDQREETFRLSDARRKVAVLTFLYTSCTDVCPFIGVKLRRTIDLRGKKTLIVAAVDVFLPRRSRPRLPLVEGSIPGEES